MKQTETNQQAPELDASDRCDRCGAQAFVMTAFVTGPLMWCAHHFARWSDSIREQGGVVVLDERNRINVRPMPEPAGASR